MLNCPPDLDTIGAILASNNHAAAAMGITEGERYYHLVSYSMLIINFTYECTYTFKLNIGANTGTI